MHASLRGSRSWLHTNNGKAKSVGLLPPAEPYRPDKANRNEASAMPRSQEVSGLSGSTGPAEGLWCRLHSRRELALGAVPLRLAQPCKLQEKGPLLFSLMRSQGSGTGFAAVSSELAEGWEPSQDLRPQQSCVKWKESRGEWRGKAEEYGDVYHLHPRACDVPSSCFTLRWAGTCHREWGSNSRMGTLQPALGTVLLPGLCMRPASAWLNRGSGDVLKGHAEDPGRCKDSKPCLALWEGEQGSSPLSAPLVLVTCWKSSIFLLALLVCSQTHEVEGRVVLGLGYKWMAVGFGGRLSEKTPPSNPKHMYHS